MSSVVRSALTKRAYPTDTVGAVSNRATKKRAYKARLPNKHRRRGLQPRNKKAEQDIQDVQDIQDEEAFGSPSVFLVMNPLILAILSVLAILLPFSAD